MRIELERLSSGRESLQQTRQLVDLVDRNRNWLDGSPYEGALSRWGRGWVRGITHTLEVAKYDPFLEAYLILAGAEEAQSDSDLGLIGVGTIVRRQSIVHRSLPIVSGTNPDYWLDAKADKHYAIHQAVGSAMLRRTVQSVVEATNPDHDIPIFATTEAGKQFHQPVGLAGRMESLGGPAPYGIPMVGPADDGIDWFNVTKGGRPLEVYTYTASHPFNEFLP